MIEHCEKGAPRPYKKDSGISYALGAYAAIELLLARPQAARAVYAHTEYEEKDALFELCRTARVPFFISDKAILRVSGKESCLVAAAFTPYETALLAYKPHIVLVNPSDMGNLGAILRIAAGLSLIDVAIIQPSADVFHPKCVRASMGALFRVRCARFESFEAYRSLYPAHALFPFLLSAKTALTAQNCPSAPLFSLLFGNEKHGLSEADFQNVGTPVRIKQSALVDSYNLSVAVGIGAYLFASKNGLI